MRPFRAIKDSEFQAGQHIPGVPKQRQLSEPGQILTEAAIRRRVVCGRYVGNGLSGFFFTC